MNRTSPAAAAFPNPIRFSRSTPPGAHDRRRSPPFRRAVANRFAAALFRVFVSIFLARPRPASRRVTSTGRPFRSTGGKRTQADRNGALNRESGPPPAFLPQRSADEERRSPRRPSVGGRWNAVALGDSWNPQHHGNAVRSQPAESQRCKGFLNSADSRGPTQPKSPQISPSKGSPRPLAKPAPEGSALLFHCFSSLPWSPGPHDFLLLLARTRPSAATFARPSTFRVRRRPSPVTCPIEGLVSGFPACFLARCRRASAARQYRTRPDRPTPIPGGGRFPRRTSRRFHAFDRFHGARGVSLASSHGRRDGVEAAVQPLKPHQRFSPRAASPAAQPPTDSRAGAEDAQAD